MRVYQIDRHRILLANKSNLFYSDKQINHNKFSFVHLIQLTYIICSITSSRLSNIITIF